MELILLVVVILLELEDVVDDLVLAVVELELDALVVVAATLFNCWIVATVVVEEEDADVTSLAPLMTVLL